uniref:Uncharacterized protein n=1 Tax=Ciona savignyi TaxID=51511 RepID=H2YGI5_CIOSA
MTLPKPSPPEINSCSGYESQNCSSSDTSHRSYDETHENIHTHPLDSRSRYFNHYVNQRPLFHNRIHDTSSFGYPHHTGPRCSNASPFDFRSRKDTSSVDDKYEWDSEYAMESEIIEAIKTFESFKGPKKVSKGLRLQLQTLGIEDNPDTNESQTESEYLEVTNDTICGAWSSPSPEDDNYTKASIEKRCAALKQEYMEYQRRKTSDNDTDISQ